MVTLICKSRQPRNKPIGSLLLARPCFQVYTSSYSSSSSSSSFPSSSSSSFSSSIKSSLASIKIDKQDAENYDSIYVVITHNNKKLILATVYRPPKLQAVDDTALYNEIQSLIQGKNATVIRDFNCANVDWLLLIGDQEGSRLIKW